MSDMHIMPSPRHVDIAITGKCNLTCQYCFYADEMTARGDLPTERWLAFFEELGRLGVMTVCLTGGEVFTRTDLFELIDGIVANRMRYQLLTNATLITEKILAKFEIGKRRLRLESIQVSVDGSRSEIHNQSRPNSFDRTIRGLLLLKKEGFPLTVRVTINRFNVDDLENIVQLLLDEIGLSGIGTNDAFSCGATDRAEGGIRLTPTQRIQAMQIITDLSKRYPGRIDAQAGPLALAREIGMIEQARSSGVTALSGRGSLSGCGGVFNNIAILHDGSIVPCHILSTLILGNITKDDLGQIWLSHSLMNAIRQRREISLQSLDTCCDCSFQGFCTGGCPGGALYINGEMNTCNPIDCYRVLLGKADPGEDKTGDILVPSQASLTKEL